MSALIEALKRISAWAKQNYYVEEHAPSDWRSGLTYEEIEAAVRDLPLRLPVEVYELYQWRNGCPTVIYQKDGKLLWSNYCEFIYDVVHFLPLEEAVQIFVDALEDNCDVRLFPIFSYENGTYVISVNEQQQEVTPIWNVDDLPETHRIQIAPSLTNLMQFLAEYLEAEAECNKSGDFEKRDLIYDSLRHKYSVKW